MNTLVFDIETIPDTESGARLFDLQNLSAHDRAEAMFAIQRDKNGRDFLPHHLQRICAISVVLRTTDKIAIWSLGEESSTEAELIQRFFEGIERYTPTLVSWNGSGFDLPVLHYRALLHKISAERYWESGDSDSSFKWNNYLNRYHSRHTDLMDVLGGYVTRAPLDQIASILGYPGKMGMDGSQVWSCFQEGHIADIRHYCETDVLNTYLVYLRYQLMRGIFDEERLTREEKLLRETLMKEDKPHFNEFLAAWSTE